MLSKRRDARRLVDQVGVWFHSIDVGHGVTTPGLKSAETLAAELETMDLPEDLTGRFVLDIGGWDGYFAFEAERRGAAPVAVLDHYTWSLDLVGQQAYWRECLEAGVHPEPYHETEYWHPDTLPGKHGFDTARSLRDSRVEAIAVDFLACDLAAVGSWDVVLYLGVLYHMEDPLRALRRLAAVTRELAIVETEAVVVPGHENAALWRFFPGAGLTVLPLDHVGDGGARQHGPRRLGGLAEDRLRARAELAVEQLDDLEHRDLGRLARERVAALDASLGAQDAGPAQDREELLEELDGDVAAAGELADRDRALAAGPRQLGERAQRVWRLARDRQHVGSIVGQPAEVRLRSRPRPSAPRRARPSGSCPACGRCGRA